MQEEAEDGKSSEIEAPRRDATKFDQYVTQQEDPPEILTSIASIDDPDRWRTPSRRHLPLGWRTKQRVLDLADIKLRGRPLRAARCELDILSVDRSIRGRVEAPDGKEPARLLPQRTGQGHPEGAQRGAGTARTSKRSRKDQKLARCLSRRARPRSELKSSQAHVAHVGGATVVRNYIDVLWPALEQEDQDQSTIWRLRRTCSMRTTTAWTRSRTVSSNTSRCSAWTSKGAHPHCASWALRA